jgi:hypothetical protein
MFHASVKHIKNNIAIFFTEGRQKLVNYTFREPSKNRSVRCQFQIAVSASFVSNQL